MHGKLVVQTNQFRKSETMKVTPFCAAAALAAALAGSPALAADTNANPTTQAGQRPPTGTLANYPWTA